jgi:hypothetical protein
VALSLPLPPGAREIEVFKIFRPKAAKAAKAVTEFEQISDKLVLPVEKCCGDLHYYKICYQLA